MDISICFKIPTLFLNFLYDMSEILQDESIYYPFLFFIKHNKSQFNLLPYLSFEIENQSNKHSGGGIINASKFSHYGFLVSNERNIFDTYKK